MAPWQSQKRDGKIGPRKSLVERETKQKLAGRDEEHQRRDGKIPISLFSRARLNQDGYRHMHFIFRYKYITLVTKVKTTSSYTIVQNEIKNRDNTCKGLDLKSDDNCRHEFERNCI